MPANAPTTAVNFSGVGQGFSGPAGTFTVQAAPPDTNGAVGPNHYVQVVNVDFAVFNKSGTVIYGPVQINTVWSGFGGGCETNNDGDPSVRYDAIADRWVISQFSVTTMPYLECVAISQSPDPTGAYNRYSFQYTDFPDYPKISVWPDAYYVTYNMFAGGTTFNGARVCALDRTRMLAGQTANQQCFNTTTAYGGLLTSGLDGARQPPARSPNYVLGLGTGTNDLAFWKFHVDWANPASTTFTGPSTITVGTYSAPCSRDCIPQGGTSQKLDSLADRLMDRLAYRNFGDHEALVVNHSVTAGSSVGVRWYEIRTPATTPAVFQQGTYAPDGNYRWMGSIAMDQSGDMGLGFSLSGSSVHPAIHYTGRLVGDPLGTMGQGEGTIIDGAGSQSGSSGLARWGDYSNMSVDPVDDCTFWYTNEYIAATGEFNWSTRIASFKFQNCGQPANDFSMSANPSSLSLTQGASGTSTISTAVKSGSAQTISLAVSGVPSGANAGLNPTSVTAGGTSTLTVNARTAAPGTYPLTITGTSPTTSRTATVSLTVLGAPTTQVTAPANGATVSGMVNVTATASPAPGTTLSSLAIAIDGVQVQSGATSPQSYSWNTTALAVGTNHTIVSTAIDADGGASSSQVVSVTIAKRAQAITFTSTPPANAVYGGPPYAVSASAGSGLPVTLTIDPPATSVCAISGGKVSFIGVGTCVIDANQSGDATYNAAPQVSQSFAVAPADSSTSLTSSANPSGLGQAVTFAATVAARPPSGATPTGSVTFRDGGALLGTAALSGGVATLSVSTLSLGNHAITATYGGTANFTGSTSAALTQVVAQAPTVLVAAPARRLFPTYQATLTRASDGTPLAGRTVTFSVSGSAICTAVTNANGTATCRTFGVVIGPSTYTARFAGDANYLPAVATARLV